ncbi:hypothetical protein [Brucella pseudogrignonensis]|uniref:Uncharacterized protein n=1 Tax=Brucella pseudogrignonensis TaxID=419475 RepID=A0ABU1M5V5_9HYPH|nr:hypothetical protein [Brucella pseudogrignonensis]MDR6431225.1 hypothetical protein [Brucella pseudogrignonensis]
MPTGLLVGNTSQAVSKIQDTLTHPGSNMRLVMEILQKMEAAQKKGH